MNWPFGIDLLAKFFITTSQSNCPLKLVSRLWHLRHKRIALRSSYVMYFAIGQLCCIYFRRRNGTKSTRCYASKTEITASYCRRFSYFMGRPCESRPSITPIPRGCCGKGFTRIFLGGLHKDSFDTWRHSIFMQTTFYARSRTRAYIQSSGVSPAVRTLSII